MTSVPAFQRGMWTAHVVLPWFVLSTRRYAPSHTEPHTSAGVAAADWSAALADGALGDLARSSTRPVWPPLTLEALLDVLSAARRSVAEEVATAPAPPERPCGVAVACCWAKTVALTADSTVTSPPHVRWMGQPADHRLMRSVATKPPA